MHPHMIHFSRISKRDITRIVIVMAISFAAAFIVNALHSIELPLFLPEGKRPGIPKGVWNEIRYVGIDKAYEQVSQGKGILIDIRDKREYDELHAECSINIPYHEFESIYPDYAQKIRDYPSIFIICNGRLCGLSVRVAKKLLDLKHNNIIITKQDFEDWKDSDLPVEKSKEPENDPSEER